MGMQQTLVVHFPFVDLFLPNLFCFPFTIIIKPVKNIDHLGIISTCSPRPWSATDTALQNDAGTAAASTNLKLHSVYCMAGSTRYWGIKPGRAGVVWFVSTIDELPRRRTKSKVEVADGDRRLCETSDYNGIEGAGSPMD